MPLRGEAPAPARADGARPPRRSRRDLPAYAYVPGRTPHPFRHPAGHAWVGGGTPAAPTWTLGPWTHDEAWLWGVELFEQGYPWEAHEVWEGIWRQVPATLPHRSLLQALIQLAGAQVKERQGDARGLASLQARGRARLDGVAQTTPVCHGLDVGATLKALDAGEARLVLVEPACG